MLSRAASDKSAANAREFSIARALALQVRALTTEQVARGWFGRSKFPLEEADAALHRLHTSGLVERIKVEAHPLTPLSQPLFSWKPRTPFPDEGKWEMIAESARQRWRLAHTPIEAFRASKRASRVFGAFVDARHLRSCEASHDLHLSEVFVLYCLKKPRLAARWLGESAFPKLGFDIRGMKDPDAFLVDVSGVGMRVIECSGRYKAEHLREFHLHCAGGAAFRLKGGFSEAKMIERLYPPGGIGYELW